jgi:hypothetical protein
MRSLNAAQVVPCEVRPLHISTATQNDHCADGPQCISAAAHIYHGADWPLRRSTDAQIDRFAARARLCQTSAQTELCGCRSLGSPNPNPAQLDRCADLPLRTSIASHFGCCADRPRGSQTTAQIDRLVGRMLRRSTSDQHALCSSWSLRNRPLFSPTAAHPDSCSARHPRSHTAAQPDSCADRPLFRKICVALPLRAPTASQHNR